MKKLTALLILILSVMAAAAQDNSLFSTRPGLVTTAELSQKSYPYDTEAEAAVIFERGTYRFLQYETNNARGFKLHMTVTTKIKIYSDAGLDFASIQIPYYSPSYEPEVLSVEGMTYNMDNGTITTTPLSKANIFTETGSDDWCVKKIAFPGVRAGSVIELKYTVETPYFFNMRPWRFQKKIPVFYSSLDYYAIPFYEYAFIAKGLNKFDEEKHTPLTTEHKFGQYGYREMLYSFGMNRVAAFRDEEFLYNIDDYMANLYFQLSRKLSYSTGLMTDIITTWPDLCRDRLKDADFGGFLGGAEKSGKKIVAELGLEGKSPDEVFEAVTIYVKSNYVWDRQAGTYSNKKTAAFLKEKRGNSTAINLFLTGLLRACGLDAWPVLASSRENGIIYKDYPFNQSFDNTISLVKIDGKNLFADATRPLTSYDEVPWQFANVEGLVVDKREPCWVRVTQSRLSKESYQMVVDLLPEEGEMRVKLKNDTYGDAAHRLRRIYGGDIEKLRDMYRGNAGMIIEDISAANYRETSLPFRVNIDYAVRTGEGGAMPEKIYFNPLIYVTPGSNPFQQAMRTHPVDLAFKSQTNYFVEVNIPEGYSVEYLPESVTRTNDVMNILYNVRNGGDGKLVISAAYTLKNFYQPQEYITLRNLYDELVRAFSEIIILRKD